MVFVLWDLTPACEGNLSMESCPFKISTYKSNHKCNVIPFNLAIDMILVHNKHEAGRFHGSNGTERSPEQKKRQFFRCPFPFLKRRINSRQKKRSMNMNIVCIYILYTASLRLETLVSQRCVSKKGL